MTDPINQTVIIEALNNSTMESQLQSMRVRELQEEVDRLKPYEYDSNMAALFMAQKGMKYEYMNFLLRQQASRPKLKLVGEE